MIQGLLNRQNKPQHMLEISTTVTLFGVRNYQRNHLRMKWTSCSSKLVMPSIPEFKVNLTKTIPKVNHLEKRIKRKGEREESLARTKKWEKGQNQILTLTLALTMKWPCLWIQAQIQTSMNQSIKLPRNLRMEMAQRAIGALATSVRAALHPGLAPANTSTMSMTTAIPGSTSRQPNHVGTNLTQNGHSKKDSKEESSAHSKKCLHSLPLAE